MGCCPWGHTELDTTEATLQQKQQQQQQTHGECLFKIESLGLFPGHSGLAICMGVWSGCLYQALPPGSHPALSTEGASTPCPDPGVGSQANLLSVVMVTLGTMGPAPGYDPREAGPEPALQPPPPPL